MKEYNHNKEIKIILTQVLDALGDLVIKRVEESTGLEKDKIHVNLRYSPKSRIIHDIVNKNQHIQLPVMALSITGISYDSSRTFNKISGFYTDVPNASSFGKHYQPLPVNINLNLSILSRYQNDLDQIITCIFNFFHPYIVISYIHPEVNQEVRCVVQWDGNLNIQYPQDLNATTPYRITADSSFKVSGWIYRNYPNVVGKIYKIDHNFQSVKDIEDYYFMLDERTEINTDFITTSARPFINRVEPYITLSGVENKQFYIYGDMFQFLSAICVSGTEGVYPSSYEIDYFSKFEKLSAAYPSFYGLSVENFEILGDKVAKFTLPTPETTGFITILPVNEAGYGNLIIDSIRPEFNPYSPEMDEYNSYVEPQFDWVNGIVIKTVNN